MEVKSTQQQNSAVASVASLASIASEGGYDNDNVASVSHDDDITILQDSLTPINTKSTIHFPDPDVLNSYMYPSHGGGGGQEATVLPTLCPDGVTLGYDNWFLLRWV